MDSKTAAQLGERSLGRSSSASSGLRPNTAAFEKTRHQSQEKYRQQSAYSSVGLFSRTAPASGGFGSETNGRFQDFLKMQEDKVKLKMAEPVPALGPVLTYEEGCVPHHLRSRCMVTLPLPDHLKEGMGAPMPTPSQIADDESLAPGLKRELCDVMKKFAVCMFDLREGLRVLVLGGTASPLGTQKVWPPRMQRKPPTLEETLKVYHCYAEIIADSGGSAEGTAGEAEVVDEADSSNPFAEGLSGVDASASSESRPGSKGSSAEAGMATMSWQAMNMFAEGKQSDAEDARVKGVCTALIRALKHFRQEEAPPGVRRDGVSITNLFRWLWPFESKASIANMLSWICLEELEKIRVPTPPVVSDDDGKLLESVFKLMDLDGKGHLTDWDMAGGDPSDIMVSLANTVDPQTVLHVLGPGPFDLAQFKEIMCTDDYRGHKNAKRVVKSDGRIILHTLREAVGFDGWLLRDPSADEIVRRRLVASIEADVIRWKSGHIEHWFC